jgi:predicted metal-binding protein
MAEPRPSLHICTTCRAAQPDGASAAGMQLYEAVAGVLADLGDAAPVALRPIVCLANCEQGCSASISMPGKWTYLLGHMGPGHAADLVAYAAAYAASENGTVWRSGRADSLRHAIVARTPGYNFTQKETA